TASPGRATEFVASAGALMVFLPAIYPHLQKLQGADEELLASAKEALDAETISQALELIGDVMDLAGAWGDIDGGVDGGGRLWRRGRRLRGWVRHERTGTHETGRPPGRTATGAPRRGRGARLRRPAAGPGAAVAGPQARSRRRPGLAGAAGGIGGGV